MADERGQSQALIDQPLGDGAAGRRPALLGTRLDVGQVIDTVRAHSAEDAVRDRVDWLHPGTGHP